MADEDEGKTVFVLLPGAGGAATWLYRELTPLLRAAGHGALPVDFTAADAARGLPGYADAVVAAMAVGAGRGAVLVAQSLAGFTAPLVAQRVPLRAVVLLNAMIPVPGERPGEWWGNVDSETARLDAARRGGYTIDIDLDVYFGHDVDPAVWAADTPEQHDEPDAVFDSVCAFEAWPDIAQRVVAGADDRFFPVGLQQRLARERLGIEADVRPGGHLLPLSQPKALAEYLLAL